MFPLIYYNWLSGNLQDLQIEAKVLNLIVDSINLSPVLMIIG